MNKYCFCCGKELLADNRSNWHDTCIHKFFGTYNLPDFSSLEEQLENLAKEVLGSGNSITGVQRKLSLDLFKPGKNNRLTIIGSSNYIIKTEDERFPHIVLLEQTLMLMAEASHIEVVPHAIIRVKDDRYIYITKRIDRNGKKKYPMEDFCQLSNKLTEYKYNGSYELCYRLPLSYSSQRAIDSIKFFNIVLFSYLTGNTDMHLKNFSLINQGQGYKLAPSYDLVPSEFIINQKEMALSLNGKRQNLTKNDFIHFGEYMNINKTQSKLLIERMIDDSSKWFKVIDHSPLDEDTKDKYKSFIKNKIDKFND